MTKSPKISRETTQIEKMRRGTVILARALMESQIMLARNQGYIDRVRETEAAASDSGDPLPDGIEKLRAFLTKGPSREASAIIEVMSPDLLDQVLGKPDDGTERSDIL